MLSLASSPAWLLKQLYLTSHRLMRSDSMLCDTLTICYWYFISLCLNSVSEQCVWLSGTWWVCRGYPSWLCCFLVVLPSANHILLTCLNLCKYIEGGCFKKNFSVEGLSVEDHWEKHYYHFWSGEFYHSLRRLLVWVQSTLMSKTEALWIFIIVCPHLSRSLLAEEVVLHRHAEITNKQIPYNL